MHTHTCLDINIWKIWQRMDIKLSTFLSISTRQCHSTKDRIHWLWRVTKDVLFKVSSTEQRCVACFPKLSHKHVPTIITFLQHQPAALNGGLPSARGISRQALPPGVCQSPCVQLSGHLPDRLGHCWSHRFHQMHKENVSHSFNLFFLEIPVQRMLSSSRWDVQRQVAGAPPEQRWGEQSSFHGPFRKSTLGRINAHGQQHLSGQEGYYG